MLKCLQQRESDAASPEKEPHYGEMQSDACGERRQKSDEPLVFQDVPSQDVPQEGVRAGWVETAKNE